MSVTSVLVTDAASGIGRAVCRLAARDGHHMHALDMNADGWSRPSRMFAVRVARRDRARGGRGVLVRKVSPAANEHGQRGGELLGAVFLEHDGDRRLALENLLARFGDHGGVADEQEVLGRGSMSRVCFVGGTVRRDRGAHSDTIGVLLRHLEQRGFSYAPRYLGVDEQGRDVLSRLPGLPVPTLRGDGQLVEGPCRGGVPARHG